LTGARPRSHHQPPIATAITTPSATRLLSRMRSAYHIERPRPSAVRCTGPAPVMNVFLRSNPPRRHHALPGPGRLARSQLRAWIEHDLDPPVRRLALAD